jgi:hypothetical protein
VLLEKAVEPHLVAQRKNLGIDAFAADDERRGRAGTLGVDEPRWPPPGLPTDIKHRDAELVRHDVRDVSLGRDGHQQILISGAPRPGGPVSATLLLSVFS